MDMMLRAGGGITALPPALTTNLPVQGERLMAAQHHTHLGTYFHPDDPGGYLKPDDKLVVDGLDFSWCFVVYGIIPDFPDCRAGTNGTVWTRGRTYGRPEHRCPWRQRKPQRMNSDYLFVMLRQGGRKFNRSVHRLVLETFFGPRSDAEQCCHFPDPDRTNNRLSNLRWDTHWGNYLDRKVHGSDQMGSRNNGAKLSEVDIPIIRRLFRSGRRRREIARRFGISVTNVRLIANGKAWTHISDEVTDA
jgi:hypothetical protein